MTSASQLREQARSSHRAILVMCAGVVSPFEYTGLVWATILGWLIWQGLPDLWTYAGAAIIIASGIYLILRESGQSPTRDEGADEE